MLRTFSPWNLFFSRITLPSPLFATTHNYLPIAPKVKSGDDQVHGNILCYHLLALFPLWIVQRPPLHSQPLQPKDTVLTSEVFRQTEKLCLTQEDCHQTRKASYETDGRNA